MSENKNQVVQSPLKMMNVFLTSDAVKNRVNAIVSDPKRGAKFISSLVSAVNANQSLATCDQFSLINSALLGEALNLTPSPQLGQYYIVPFKKNVGKANETTIATFILGYKGYIQLAMRTGQYEYINVTEVKEGELKGFDRLTGEGSFFWINDEIEREKKKTVGYVATFKLINGFKKILYWSSEKMKNHAVTYSPGYSSDIKKGTKFTFWSKNYDDMAFKTLIRQIISKWGFMSIEMVDAFERDGAEIDNDNNPVYVDNIPTNQLELQEEVDESANQETLEVDETTPEPEQPKGPGF